MKQCYLVFLTVLAVLRPVELQTTTPAQLCKNKYDESDMSGNCGAIETCTGAAVESNDCTSGQICCVPDVKPAYKSNTLLSQESFLRIAGNTSRNAEMYYYFIESLNGAEIKTKFQIAAYLSQLIGETDYFKKIDSARPEKDVDQTIGNNGTGDGVFYRGRGCVLLRGKNNYFLANNKLSGIRSSSRYGTIRFDIFKSPEKVAFPSIAFKVASWFWNENAYIIKSTEKAVKSSLNQLADGTFLSFAQLTYALSNKLKSLKDRAKINERILDELKFVSMKRGQGVRCELKDGEVGYAVPICLIDFKKPYCGCEGRMEIQTCPYGPMASGSCRNSAMIKCCVEQCYASLDLVVLIDTSGSILEEGLEKSKMFVSKLVDNLAMDKGETRVSVLEFNNRASILIDLANGTSSAKVKEVIGKIRYRGGQTNTAQALQYTNDLVLREDRGMRPLGGDIPKIVITITDGESDSPIRTKAEANKIKQREVNMISVGVGESVNIEELFAISSTANDQYYVDDYDKIMSIITSITVKACQQPVALEQEKEVLTKVEKNTYKYFKYPLVPIEARSGNRTYQKEFTITMLEFKGDSKLQFSFDEENPKDTDDYGNESDNAKEADVNFYEDGTINMKRNRRSVERIANENKNVSEMEVQRTRYYQVSNPDDNDVLYLSLFGTQNDNLVKVLVYNRTVVDPNTTDENSSFTLIAMIVGIVVGAVLLVTLIGFLIYKRMDKTN